MKMVNRNSRQTKGHNLWTLINNTCQFVGTPLKYIGVGTIIYGTITRNLEVVAYGAALTFGGYALVSGSAQRQQTMDLNKMRKTVDLLVSELPTQKTDKQN